MQHVTPVVVIISAVVGSMLVATPGIIVSSQIAFAVPPGVSGPGNAQGQCYSQGTAPSSPPPAGFTGNIPNHAAGITGMGGNPQKSSDTSGRNPFCPPPVGLATGKTK